MTGWDEDIWCFRLASFVGAAFAVDVRDVALDEDDVDLDEDDAASDDAALAVDVAALDVTTGDAGWLLVVEEMLNFTVINRKENFF